MRRPRHVLLPALLLAGLLLGGCSGTDDEVAVPEHESIMEETVAIEQSDPSAPLPRNTVEVYFPSVSSNGLIGEYRQIFDTANPSDKVKQIIADLISGPDGAGTLRAVPPATRLRQAYVLNNGVAYLDFSAHLMEDIGGGSMEEILAAYAIINSIVVNIPEVRRVGILVNGRPLATLNGHLDLRRPLPANYSLIIGSIKAERAESGPKLLASTAE
jgi:spore germination protein GerM